MIPLAAWAGMPSTACVCANGQMKLFCGHRAAVAKAAVDDEPPCESACCGGLAETDSSQVSDCCGGGACCHGGKSNEAGIHGKACCRQISTAPGISPKATVEASDESAASFAVVERLGMFARPLFRASAVEFDTGPPLDRVVVFRSLLI